MIDYSKFKKVLRSSKKQTIKEKLENYYVISGYDLYEIIAKAYDCGEVRPDRNNEWPEQKYTIDQVFDYAASLKELTPWYVKVYNSATRLIRSLYVFTLH